MEDQLFVPREFRALAVDALRVGDVIRYNINKSPENYHRYCCASGITTDIQITSSLQAQKSPVIWIFVVILYVISCANGKLTTKNILSFDNEVSIVMGAPNSWMVYNGTSYESMDDLGVPPL